MAEWLLLRLPRGADGNSSWLVVDAEGRPLAPPESGTLEAATRQADGRSLALLLPASDVLLTEVELPQGAGSRAAELAPYALEEQLIGDLDALHCAVARVPAGQPVPVAVVARERLVAYLAQLQSAGMQPQLACAEQSLLPGLGGRAVALLEGDTLSLRDAQGRVQVLSAPAGSLAAALGVLLGETRAATELVLHVTPADWPLRQAEVESLRPALASLQVQLLGQGPLPWLAPALLGSAPLNLLQGPFAPRGAVGASWQRWRVAAALAGGLLLLHVAGQGWRLQQLARREQELDASLLVLAGPALPPGPGSVRARIERSLLARQGDDADGGLLPAMQALAQALGAVPGARIQALDFRAGVLQLKLRAASAQSLEQINQSLRSSGWQSELVSGGAAGDAYEGSLRVAGRLS